MVIWIKFAQPWPFSLISKISRFPLAISCLTTSDLPWFVDLTFQVPIQYCSLQHQTLLSPPDTSATGSHFYFGPVASFFLELLVIALCSSPVAYWTPSNLRGLSSGVISLCLFIPFMVFSQQESLRGLPFPLPVDHILSEVFTITHPSWVALQGMVHGFIELCKPFHHDNAIIHEG